MWTAFLLKFADFLVRRRYRMDWRGLEHLNPPGAYLVLPNHPAEIDPLLLLTRLWPRLRLRPVMLGQYARVFLIGLYVRALRTILMPDLELDGSAQAVEGVRRTIDAVIASLARGESILLYPSGRLMRDGLERIGGASAAFEAAQRAPGARICLVRTRGLFGSLSSTAQSGAVPSVPGFLLKGAWLLVRHGVFWLPKRQITIEVCPAPEALRAAAAKQEFNTILEEWYNAPGPEQPTSNLDAPGWLSFKRCEEETAAAVPCDDRWRIIQAKLSEMGGRPAAQITGALLLREDLCLDSIQIAELAQWLHDEFSCRVPSVRRLRRASDVYHYSRVPAK